MTNSETIQPGSTFVAFDGKTYRAVQIGYGNSPETIVAVLVKKNGKDGVQRYYFAPQQITSPTQASPRFIVKFNPLTTWEPYEVVDTLTDVTHEGSSSPTHSQRIADRMNLEAKPPVILTPKNRADFLKLSYFTLCKLQSTTHFANPIDGLPIAIERGEFKGILTVDHLGNFISFE